MLNKKLLVNQVHSFEDYTHPVYSFITWKNFSITFALKKVQ